MSTSSRLYYRRAFLNRPRHHLGAHVIAEVSADSYAKGGDRLDASIHLADCYRCIDIDLSAGTRREASNALHKIALLRTILDEVEAAMTAGLEELDLRPMRR